MNSEQTDASGLIYMQARFYLPMYGRFGSPDPARDQHFEQTQSWNIYSYVQNNPVMRADPTGMALDTNDVKKTAEVLSKIAPNANTVYKDGKWTTSLKDGAKTSKGFELIQKIIGHSNTLTLNWKESGKSAGDLPNGGNATVNVNPSRVVNASVVSRSLVDLDKGTRPMMGVQKENMPVELTVAHELIHGLNALEGVLGSTTKNNENVISMMPRKTEKISDEEKSTIGLIGSGRSDSITENAIRGELGNSNFRVAHDGSFN